MGIRKCKFITFIITLLFSANALCNSAEITQIKDSFIYLISDRSSGGALYVGTAGDLNGLSLPLSYVDTPSYWGYYVCTSLQNNCYVTDTYHTNDYTLTPDSSPGGKLQVERVNVHNGTDIYDAATWQIGVELGEAVNHFAEDNYDTLSNNQNTYLNLGYDGNACLLYTSPSPRD